MIALIKKVFGYKKQDEIYHQDEIYLYPQDARLLYQQLFKA